jgi:hypothetical protein
VRRKLLKWFLKSFVTRLCQGLAVLLFVFILSFIIGNSLPPTERSPIIEWGTLIPIIPLRNQPMFTFEGFEQMFLILLLAFGILLISFVIAVQYFDNQTHNATNQ